MRRMLVMALVLVLFGGCSDDGADESATTSSTSPGEVRVAVYKVVVGIPAGTMGEEAIAEGFIELSEIPREFRPPHAVADLDSIEGLVATEDLSVNQVLVDGMFGDASGRSADCASPASPPPRREVDGVVTVYLYCGLGVAPPDLRPVERVVPLAVAADPLVGALEQLLLGATPSESAAGLGSAFSSYTAGQLNSVSVSTGVATLDFGSGFASGNNFSTSNVSAVILSQVEATVFQFPEIDGIEVRIDGQRWCGWENTCDGEPVPLISR